MTSYQNVTFLRLLIFLTSNRFSLNILASPEEVINDMLDREQPIIFSNKADISRQILDRDTLHARCTISQLSPRVERMLSR